jgi:hypothetical protein
VTRRKGRSAWNENATGAFTAAAWLAVSVVWDFLIKVKWVDGEKRWGGRPHLLIEPTDVSVGNCAESFNVTSA